MSTISIDNKVLNINDELEPILTPIGELQQANKSLKKENAQLKSDLALAESKKKQNKNSGYKSVEKTEGIETENDDSIWNCKNDIIDLIEQIERATTELVAKTAILEALNLIKNKFN